MSFWLKAWGKTEMCVCVCVCVCECVCAHIHVHVYASAHTQVCCNLQEVIILGNMQAEKATLKSAIAIT